MRNLNIVVITIAGLGFLGFGILLLCWPDMALPGVGIRALGAQAQVEVRAFYGGLEIGLVVGQNVLRKNILPLELIAHPTTREDRHGQIRSPKTSIFHAPQLCHAHEFIATFERF